MTKKHSMHRRLFHPRLGQSFRGTFRLALLICVCLFLYWSIFAFNSINPVHNAQKLHHRFEEVFFSQINKSTQHLFIHWSGHDFQLTRNNQDWRLISIRNTPAIDTRVQNSTLTHLLDILRNSLDLQQIQSIKRTHPLSYYGLDRPFFSIKLKNELKSTPLFDLNLGFTDESQNNVFAHDLIQDKIYLIGGSILKFLEMKNPYDLSDRKIVTFARDDIEEISASKNCNISRWKKLIRDGDRWSMIKEQTATPVVLSIKKSDDFEDAIAPFLHEKYLNILPSQEQKIETLSGISKLPATQKNCSLTFLVRRQKNKITETISVSNLSTDKDLYLTNTSIENGLMKVDPSYFIRFLQTLKNIANRKTP